MDVNLEMCVGGVEPSTFVRTAPTEDTSPAGAFEALIAALSCVPVADVPAPPPPVVWSGLPGLPAAVGQDEVVPQAAVPHGDPIAQTEQTGLTALTPDSTEDAPVAVPLHLIPGVVAMALPASVAGSPDAGPPSARQDTPPAAVVTVTPVAAPPAGATAPAAPVTSPPAATPAVASAAPHVMPPLADAGPEAGDVQVAASSALAEPAPVTPSMGTGTRAATTAAGTHAAATPVPRVDVATFTRPVPHDEPTLAATASRPAATPESAAAPTSKPVVSASAVSAAVTVSPGQVVEPAFHVQLTPTGQADATSYVRPTTEDGQPLETRLVEVMRWQAKEGGGRVEMKLRPEYLGPMTVTLQVEGGVVKASLAAESQATRDFLQAEAGHLKTALEDQGFTVETLEIRDDRHETREDRPRQRTPQHPGGKRSGRSAAEAQAGETFDVIV